MIVQIHKENARKEIVMKNPRTGTRGNMKKDKQKDKWMEQDGV